MMTLKTNYLFPIAVIASDLLFIFSYQEILLYLHQHFWEKIEFLGETEKNERKRISRRNKKKKMKESEIIASILQNIFFFFHKISQGKYRYFAIKVNIQKIFFEIIFSLLHKISHDKHRFFFSLGMVSIHNILLIVF